MEISFKNEEEIKDISGKQKLKVLIPNRLVLKDITKGNLQEEGKNDSR